MSSCHSGSPVAGSSASSGPSRPTSGCTSPPDTTGGSLRTVSSTGCRHSVLPSAGSRAKTTPGRAHSSRRAAYEHCGIPPPCAAGTASHAPNPPGALCAVGVPAGSEPPNACTATRLPTTASPTAPATSADRFPSRRRTRPDRSDGPDGSTEARGAGPAPASAGVSARPVRGAGMNTCVS